MLRSVCSNVTKYGKRGILISRCSSNTALDIEKLEKEAESLDGKISIISN